MGKRLLGNLEAANQYLSWADHRLTAIKRFMSLSGLLQMKRVYTLKDARVTLTSCIGIDTITIEGFGGSVFFVSGKVYAGPSVYSAHQWRIEIYEPRIGALLQRTTFGDPGEVYDQNLSFGDHEFSTFIKVIDYSAYIYETGAELSSDPHFSPRWRVERRDLSGKQMWIQVQSDLNYGEGLIFDLAVYGSGLYTCGMIYYDLLRKNPRVERRSINDGSLVWMQNIDPSYTTYNIIGVVATKDHIVYRANFFTDVFSHWLMESRDPETGGLQWSQEYSSGDFTTAPFWGGDTSSLTVDASGGVYAGGYRFDYTIPLYNEKVRVEKRKPDTGELIWEYIRPNETNLSNDTVLANGLVLGNDHLYVCIGLATNITTTYPVKLLKMKKDTGEIIWEIDLDHTSTLAENTCMVDTADDGIIMQCTESDGVGRKYFFRKRRASDGEIVWESKQSDIYGLLQYGVLATL